MHPTGSPANAAPSSSAESPSGGTPGQAPPPFPRERRQRSVGWQSKDLLRAAALIVGFYILTRLLWVAHELFFVVFLGVLFGLAVASAVDRLERFRIPRGVGAAMVVISFLGLLFGFGALMAPTLKKQSQELRSRLPEAADKLEDWVNSHQTGLFGLMLGSSRESADSSTRADSVTDREDEKKAQLSAATQDTNRTTAQTQDGARQGTLASSRPPSGDSASARETQAEERNGSPAAKLKAKLGARMGGVTKYLRTVIKSTVEVFAGTLIILFLSIYIGAEPATYRAGLMHLFPQRARKRAGEVLAAMAVSLRKWLVTQLIAMVVMAIATTIVLLILRVKAAFALGLLAGLLEFIPTVGPIISSVPAIGMGFLDSPQKALIVVFVYIAIHFLESHILIPLLMRGGVNLPPALTVVTQALMALLFGFIGLMVAVPVLAAVMVPIKMLYVEDVVGDRLDVLDEGDEDDGG